MWGPGLEFIIKTFQVFLSKGIESQLEKFLTEQQKSSLPVAVVSNYVAGAFLTLLKWWLDNGMVYSPEYMDELFLQLVMPGVQATLGVRL